MNKKKKRTQSKRCGGLTVKKSFKEIVDITFRRHEKTFEELAE